MKFLKFVWFVVLVTALFQALGPIVSAVNGDESARIPESFFGVLLVFLFLTVVIVLIWIFKWLVRSLKRTADDDVQSLVIKNDSLAEGFDYDPLQKADGEAGSNSAKSISVQADPLNAGEHLRLTAFTVLCILASWILLYFGGFIPVALLVYGYFMMKNSGDFKHVDVTVKYAKLYFQILLALSVAAGVLIIVLALISDTQVYSDLFSDAVWNISGEENVHWGFVLTPVLFFAIFYGCIAAIKHLYYMPLRRHSEWVTVNGAFSRKQKNGKVAVRSDGGDTITKRENLRQPSVADELAKWAKLRDDGLVSESEFEHARSQLLNKM